MRIFYLIQNSYAFDFSFSEPIQNNVLASSSIEEHGAFCLILFKKMVLYLHTKK